MDYITTLSGANRLRRHSDELQGGTEKEAMTANRPAKETVLLARWVLPMSSAPIANGAVIISNDRIVEVTEAEAALDEVEQKRSRGDHSQTIVDFKEAVLLPGLINLHSHVEFTYLRAAMTDAPLFDWILNLVKITAGWTPQHRRQSAHSGARLAALSGTSFVVDCSNSGDAAFALAEAGLRSLVALEIFGLREEGTDLQWQRWLEKFESVKSTSDEEVRAALSSGRLTLSISPHSPYTVSPSLWRKCNEWADELRLPVCAHLAESSEECSWLQSKCKIVNDYLAAVMPPLNGTPFDADLLEWRGKGLNPVEHLRHHGLFAERLLAAHVVHAQESDLEILKQAGASIAHCPRSNAMLRNGRADLKAILKSGIPYGIATDSLASCPDLSLLSEAKYALLAHRAADPQLRMGSRQALEAITIGAARALGMESSIGSLQPGHKADIAVFVPSSEQWQLSYSDEQDPHDLLLFGECTLSNLYVDGVRIVVNGRLVSEDV